MRTAGRVALRMLLAASVLLTAPVIASAAAPALVTSPRSAAAPEMAPHAADRATLERVYAETGAETERPSPGWGEYATSLMRRFGAWIRGVLASGLEAAGFDAGKVVYVAWAVLALAVLAVAAAVVLGLRRRRSTRGRRQGEVVPGSPPPAVATPVSWRREIDRRLAGGHVTEALEAVWWWLARALCGDRADAAWTGRELVTHGRRPDLRAPVARLDAWVYGPRRPAATEVGELVRRLEPRLEGGGAGDGGAGS